VLEISAGDPYAHRVLGTVLQARDRGAAAVASLEEATRLDPGSSEAFSELAIALAGEGGLSDTIDADRRALEICPRNVGARHHLAQLKTFSADDPDLWALKALAREEGVLARSQTAGLFLALAKAYDDVGDYDSPSDRAPGARHSLRSRPGGHLPVLLQLEPAVHQVRV